MSRVDRAPSPGKRRLATRREDLSRSIGLVITGDWQRRLLYGQSVAHQSVAHRRRQRSFIVGIDHGIGMRLSGTQMVIAIQRTAAAFATTNVGRSATITGRCDAQRATAGIARGATAAIARCGIAIATSGVPAIAPQRREARKDAAAFATRLTVVVPAVVAGIAAIGRFVDPWIDVQFATTVAAFAAAALVECQWSARVGATGHGANAATGAQQHQGNDCETGKQGGLVHRNGSR